jgi:hypothetical protein
MKTLRLVLLTALVVAAAARLHAQGTILLNNYDSRMGIFFPGDNIGALAGTRFEVLAGPTPSSLTPMMAATGRGPIFEIADEGVNALGPGSGSFFDEGYGAVVSVSPGETVFLNVRAWSAAFSTWEAAQLRDETGLWSQLVGTASTPVALAMPRPLWLTLVDIPEPSSIALAALGLVGLLIFTRRKRYPTR